MPKEQEKKEPLIARQRFLTRENLMQVVVMILLYFLLGNAREIQANPIIPGAVVAVNMIVVVLAGILFGRKVGLTVGLLGTLINALSPAGNAFEFAAIIPHAIMGYLAGYLREKKKPLIFASLAIIAGHALNILSFSMFRLLEASALATSKFWLGLAYETIFGIIVTTVLAWIYLAIMGKK